MHLHRRLVDVRLEGVVVVGKIGNAVGHGCLLVELVNSA
jgi:hypothetical protein